MNFEIISDIIHIEPIAIGDAIRDLARLRRVYGAGRWRKLKEIATIRLANGVGYGLPSYIGMRPMA